MKYLKLFIENSWVAGIVAFLLGGLFIYATIHKIADPPDFAKIVYNYRIFPWPNLVGVYMPWVELLAALALIVGVFIGKGKKGGAALIGLLLLVFMAGIGFNLARGNIVDCGCFAGSSGKSRAELLLDMWLVLGRDLLMLIGVAQIFIAERAAARKTAAA
jgi:putative oxidoreductase